MNSVISDLYYTNIKYKFIKKYISVLETKKTHDFVFEVYIHISNMDFQYFVGIELCNSFSFSNSVII